LLIIPTIVTSGLLQMTKSQKTIANRTDMHAGVRSATELLQQEVGQAGRISLPAPITLTAAVIEDDTTATLSSVNGLFVNELVTIEGSDPLVNMKPETVLITAINTAAKTITVKHVSAKGIITDRFQNKHSAAAPVTVGGTALPCFQYQMDLFKNYVLDVAITLTVQTQQVDPITQQFQTETKALLNVSPRNVIGAWQSAGVNQNRVQPMPDSVKNLLP